jgi:hypothetical protein
MWHATWTQGNQGSSWLLIVGSQIANLTPGPSFGHNLCFKNPNGSCKPILDIYVPRTFQWYKELINPMSFNPCNCLLKIQNFKFQSESSLESAKGSFPHTLLHSWEHEMWLPSSPLAPTFASPCLGLEPKAKVTISFLILIINKCNWKEIPKSSLIKLTWASGL